MCCCICCWAWWCSCWICFPIAPRRVLGWVLWVSVRRLCSGLGLGLGASRLGFCMMVVGVLGGWFVVGVPSARLNVWVRICFQMFWLMGIPPWVASWCRCCVRSCWCVWLVWGVLVGGVVLLSSVSRMVWVCWRVCFMVSCG